MRRLPTRFNKQKPSTKNEHGSVMLFAMIGISLVAVLALVYVNSYKSVRRAQAKVNFITFVAQLQLTIQNTVNDPLSWQTTLGDSSHNSAMSCIATQSCTSPRAPMNFVLWPAGALNYAALSQAVYDGTDAAAGFTLGGQRCTEFNPAGSQTCPIHVTLHWSTSGCGLPPCQAPIQIQADILFSPSPVFSGFSSINEDLLTTSFTQVLSGAAQLCSGLPAPSVQAACASPPYPNDKIFCTASGWQCGQLYF